MISNESLGSVLGSIYTQGVDMSPEDIRYISIDSRKIANPTDTIFFGIDGARKRGIDFVTQCVQMGVKGLVLDVKYRPLEVNKDVTIYWVSDVVISLQALASYHRSRHQLKVVGITGSNGKTIVKEWLSELLSPMYSLVKSPKSYNSQIGVPLSIWNIQSHHQIGIFEAGISQPNEMSKLEKIIQPSIGIYTYSGTAHLEHFESREQLINEKLKLFRHSKALIYPLDDKLLDRCIRVFRDTHSGLTLYGWSSSDPEAPIRFDIHTTSIEVYYDLRHWSIPKPFDDHSSLHNYCTTIASLLILDLSLDPYIEAMRLLRHIPMRLQVIEGIGDIKIINDTYNSDLASIRESLDFLDQQAAKMPKVAVLSEWGERDENIEISYDELIEMLTHRHLRSIHLIGTRFMMYQSKFRERLKDVFFHESIDDFQLLFPPYSFKGHTILFKGARRFEFERLIRSYQSLSHETRLEISLDAIKHNLNVFAQPLKANTKIMVMLKAFGYGLGSLELAKVLEHQKVDYVAVAYIDEGVALRNIGVQTPIMVMNTEWNALDLAIEYRLEPEIFSIESWHQYIEVWKRYASDLDSDLCIHIELDSGMNRLGFSQSDIQVLIEQLKKYPRIKVRSIFSHLAASNEPDMNDFTHIQAAIFDSMYQQISEALGYRPIQHLLNTEGIVNFPQYQYDMVRLGIGLFGINSSGLMTDRLMVPYRLMAKISQIRSISPDQTVGYSRNGRSDKPTQIAVVNIGYADGYSRAFGNGRAYVWSRGKQFYTIGNVCMDMVMIDIGSDSGLEVGDVVELLGPNVPIEVMAKVAGTIPYEILTGIHQRVKRVYYQE